MSKTFTNTEVFFVFDLLQYCHFLKTVYVSLWCRKFFLLNIFLAAFVNPSPLFKRELTQMLIAMKYNVPGGSINEQPIEQAQCPIFNSQNLATHKKRYAFLALTRIYLQTSSEMAILLLYTGNYKRDKNMYFI